MRKLLVSLFAVLIIGVGIVGMNHDPEPDEIMEEKDHTMPVTF